MIESKHEWISKLVFEDLGLRLIGRIIARRHGGLVQDRRITGLDSTKRLVRVTVRWWRP